MSALHDAASKPEPPSAPANESELLSLHLKSAPLHLQTKALRIAQQEETNYGKRFEAILKKSDEPEHYFSSLLLARERRMRQLVQLKLAAGSGLLIVDGLKSEDDRKRGKPAIVYSTLDQQFTRRLSVLVVMDEHDPELEDLLKTIRETRDFLMQERVITFNHLPEEERKHEVARWKQTGQLKGFSKDLLYEGEHRLVFGEPYALLSYRR